MTFGKLLDNNTPLFIFFKNKGWEGVEGIYIRCLFDTCCLAILYVRRSFKPGLSFMLLFAYYAPFTSMVI